MTRSPGGEMPATDPQQETELRERVARDLAAILGWADRACRDIGATGEAREVAAAGARVMEALAALSTQLRPHQQETERREGAALDRLAHILRDYDSGATRMTADDWARAVADILAALPAPAAPPPEAGTRHSPWCPDRYAGTGAPSRCNCAPTRREVLDGTIAALRDAATSPQPAAPTDGGGKA